MSSFLPKINSNNEQKHWYGSLTGKNKQRQPHPYNYAGSPAFSYAPDETKILPSTGKIKFTVIGNRVTKEFIFCFYVVNALHTRRRKIFEAPAIRGVTSVEWPKVWNDLKLHFGGLAFCIRSQVAVLMNDNFIGGKEEFEELIAAKYNFSAMKIDYYREGIHQFEHYIRTLNRPCAYMYLSINNNHIGVLIFMLYHDLVPNTCENFLRLCQTRKGGYSGTPVHRIVKECWIQCGGFGLKNNPNLGCENFNVPHDRRGVLCMANADRHVDCSTQFFVLLQPAPWMGQKYVAFGQLIEGEDTLKKLEQIPTWYESPIDEVTIYKAGVFNMDCTWVNRGTKIFVQKHVEDLAVLANVFWEALMKRVFEIVNLTHEEDDIEESDENLHVSVGSKQSLVEIKDNLTKVQSEENVDSREEDGNVTKKLVSELMSSLQILDINYEHRDATGQTSDTSVALEGYPGTGGGDQALFMSLSKRHEESKSMAASLGPCVPTCKFKDVGTNATEREPCVPFCDFDSRELIEIIEEVEVFEEESGMKINPSVKGSNLPSLAFDEISHLGADAKYPYFIPLTDVPYPGEVNSLFDLQRFLRGDYCFEKDLEPSRIKRRDNKFEERQLLIPEDMLDDLFENNAIDDLAAELSLSPEEQLQLEAYLNEYSDSVSFAGPIVKSIANVPEKYDITNARKIKNKCLGDEQLRVLRLAAKEYIRVQSNRVKRQSDFSVMTGRSAAWTEFNEDDDYNRPVSLKDYRSLIKKYQRRFGSISSATTKAVVKNKKEKIFGVQMTDTAIESSQELSLQSKSKEPRRISTLYDQDSDERKNERKVDVYSLTSVKFSKIRPKMSVEEYQKKTGKYQRELKSANRNPTLLPKLGM